MQLIFWPLRRLLKTHDINMIKDFINTTRRADIQLDKETSIFLECDNL